MTEELLLSVGLLLPFFGTLIGASAVLLVRRARVGALRFALLGFAAGVMLAASVWSLLIPAIELSQGWCVPALGLLLGVLLLILTDHAVARLCSPREDARERGLGRSSALILAVTLHNLPEGMAVGAVIAGVLGGSDTVGMAGAIALAFGIALQNLPEGAIVSMPLLGEGRGRFGAFLIGVLSGAVEPIGAVGMLIFAARLSPYLPLFLALAAGAMLYAAVRELIPEAESGEGGLPGTVGAALGFSLMMVLDVALG